jgi:hypothetical protein
MGKKKSRFRKPWPERNREERLNAIVKDSDWVLPQLSLDECMLLLQGIAKQKRS